MEYTFSVPCLFGLEGIVKTELAELNFAGVAAENGRVLFSGGFDACARVNLSLRAGERVLLRLGDFPADSFDALFEGVRALPWEAFIPADGAFPVKGHALDSKLFSVPDCQKIIKKAVVTRLSAHYGKGWFDETGAKHQIQFSIMHDRAEIYLDTSGMGLHKRGYRPAGNIAPIRETLAAALCMIARYDGYRPLYDPMMGSGTIAIEGALLALRKAPGLTRRFDMEKWACVPPEVFQKARNEALENVKDMKSAAPVFGSDIDAASCKLAEENARRAGVSGLLCLSKKDALAIDYTSLDAGTLITNPPYGERMGDLQSARLLYRAFGRKLMAAPALKQYIITSDPEFETHFGRVADKRRKLYNGMIQCQLFMYYKNAAKPKPERGS